MASYVSYLIPSSPVQYFSVSGQTYVFPGRAHAGCVKKSRGLTNEEERSSHWEQPPTAPYSSVKILYINQKGVLTVHGGFSLPLGAFCLISHSWYLMTTFLARTAGAWVVQ